MKKVMASLTAAAILISSPTLAKTSAEVSKEAVKTAESKAKATQEQIHIVKEAVEAVVLTKKVLIDLEKKDIKKAKEDLEKAIGKLEVILASKNAPLMLPIDSEVVAVEYTGDLKSIKESLELVKDLLDKNKVQDARRILDTLQSEIDIITINLPLASYPQALKLAAKYLNEGKIKEAEDVLDMALNTLVKEITVIPIPILKAQALVDAASKTAKKDKNQAIKHLEEAKRQLQIAEALDYTSTSDTTYKMLYDAIEKLEKEIKGKNRSEKLFENLIEKLKEFKEKAIHTLHSSETNQ